MGNQITENIKEKELKHKQSLNQIKGAIHKILSSVQSEQYNVQQSKSVMSIEKLLRSLTKQQNEQNIQIQSLNKTLSDKDKEIEKYKNDENKNESEEKNKNKQMQSLNQKLLDKDKEIEKYKNDKLKNEQQ